mmetsp:Transcript_104660/g.337347  ORF Transcript_104660/g.337347 Transcript_104660/m.337347 type:complete len:153 (-) Transcript_104660:40-498(-)
MRLRWGLRARGSRRGRLAAEASCMKVKSVGSCDAGGYVVGKLESEVVPRFPRWGQHSHDVSSGFDDGGHQSFYIGGDDGFEEVEEPHDIEEVDNGPVKDDNGPAVVALATAIAVAKRFISDAEVAGLAHPKELDETKLLLASLQRALTNQLM